MEQCLNLANLLSFVQIAVVFNFGLFFLRGKNTFKDVCAEFNLYLGALANYSLNDSLREVRRVRRTMPEEIRIQKEKTHRYYGLLKYLIEDKEEDYFILPCVGLFSGIYSLVFLLLGGLSGWKFDDLITDVLLVMAQVVLVMEMFSCLQLKGKTVEREVRYIIMVNVTWFILINIVSLVFVLCGWTYSFFSHVDYAILIFVIWTVYFPAFLLILVSLKKIFYLIFYQRLCNYHTVKLRRMLDERKK